MEPLYRVFDKLKKGHYILVQKLYNSDPYFAGPPMLLKVDFSGFVDEPTVAGHPIANGVESGEREFLYTMEGGYFPVVIGTWTSMPPDKELNEAQKRAFPGERMQREEFLAIVRSLQGGGYEA